MNLVNVKSEILNIFQKEGKIIKSFVDDPYFNLQNFEFLKAKNKNLIIIGEGSYGKVFLAKHKKTDKKYAIKVINKEKLKSKNQKLDSIYKEITIHGSLIHPNIIRLYSYSEDEKNFYFIMEFAENGTLYNIINFRRLNEEESFDYFIQVISSIYFLHKNNYVHRDLKPENLLLNIDNKIKLCDFGICTDTAFGLRETFCGTFDYMAPELMNNQPYNQSIDIWSLGILLYEMLHGYPPFKNIDKNKKFNFEELRKKVIKEDFEIDMNLHLSDECIDLIYQLLDNDSNQRIKIDEILFHPWIKKYEKKYLQETMNLNDENKIEKNMSVIEKDNNNIKIEYKEEKKIDESEEKKINENEEKKINESEEKKINESNEKKINESNEKKINENNEKKINERDEKNINILNNNKIEKNKSENEDKVIEKYVERVSGGKKRILSENQFKKYNSNSNKNDNLNNNFSIFNLINDTNEKSQNIISKKESFNCNNYPNLEKEYQNNEKEELKYPVKFFEEKDREDNYHKMKDDSKSSELQINNLMNIIENAQNLKEKKKNVKKATLHTPSVFSNFFNCSNGK